MDRFILHEIYGMSAEDRKRFGLGRYADDGSILEDTVTGETYMDGWEPEDATFIRDLGWVPALLNTLAEETATQRAEVERLTAELEEARLSALAERGDAEGLPPYWKVTARDQQGRPTSLHRTDRPGSFLYWRPMIGGGWAWYWAQERALEGSVLVEGWYTLARPAMLAWDAADAAHPLTPPASPE